MAVFIIDLGLTSGALPQATTDVGLVAFFTSFVGLHVVADILALSCASGLFVVPIFAAVQAWAGEDRRARVVGAVNTMNALYMVAGSLATTLLLKLAGLTEPTVLTILGLRERYGGDLSVPAIAKAAGLKASAKIRSGDVRERGQAHADRRLRHCDKDHCALAQI